MRLYLLTIYIIVDQVRQNIINAFQLLVIFYRNPIQNSRTLGSFFLETEEDVITLGVASLCLPVVCSVSPARVIIDRECETLKSLIPF